MSYAISGFREVSKQIELTFGVPYFDSQKILENSIKSGRRMFAFQDLLQEVNIPSKYLPKLLSIYRSHIPSIQLDPMAEKALISYEKISKYLVTDGNKFVQSKKIEALELNKYMKRCFTTHTYGLEASKPSTHCFRIIKKLEKAKWKDLVYIGDNPAKDFINLNKLGVTTIRILTGTHANVKLGKKYEAKFTISNMAQLKNVLDSVYGYSKF